MAGLAVNVAVIHDGKILLTQREDFETWILPSGGVEDGETLVHAVLFTAKPVGGELKCQEGETIAVQWFDFDNIPSPLSAGQKRRISDALSGKSGFAVSQEFTIPAYTEKISRKDLIELRDGSGLSRQAFYLKLMQDAVIEERVELDGHE